MILTILFIALVLGIITGNSKAIVQALMWLFYVFRLVVILPVVVFIIPLTLAPEGDPDAAFKYILLFGAGYLVAVFIIDEILDRITQKRGLR